MKRIGVLALQGAVTEHLKMLKQLQVESIPIRRADELTTINALIIPGGESTAISRLIQQQNMFNKIQQFALKYPVMGTCAGLILCSKQIVNDDGKVKPLGLMDITVERNGFGRQVDSFEVNLPVAGVAENIPAVFIRAPFITSVGADVKVLAKIDTKIVMAEQNKVLVMAFHPELTNDIRIFEYFISKV